MHKSDAMQMVTEMFFLRIPLKDNLCIEKSRKSSPFQRIN
jgi:hypothetical protein